MGVPLRKPRQNIAVSETSERGEEESGKKRYRSTASVTPQQHGLLSLGMVCYY